MHTTDEKLDEQLQNPTEAELFGEDVSPETLQSYMNNNFRSEAQASLVALATTLFL